MKQETNDTINRNVAKENQVVLTDVKDLPSIDLELLDQIQKELQLTYTAQVAETVQQMEENAWESVTETLIQCDTKGVAQEEQIEVDEANVETSILVKNKNKNEKSDVNANDPKKPIPSETPKTEGLLNFDTPLTSKEESAAVKIQSVFRGFKTRKQYTMTKINDRHLVHSQINRNTENNADYEHAQNFTKTVVDEAGMETREDDHTGQVDYLEHEIFPHKVKDLEVTLGKDQRIKIHKEDTHSESTSENLRFGKKFEYKNQLKLKTEEKEFDKAEEEIAFCGYKVGREMQPEHCCIKNVHAADTWKNENKEESILINQMQNLEAATNQSNDKDKNDKVTSKLVKTKDLRIENEYKNDSYNLYITPEQKIIECFGMEGKEDGVCSMEGLFRAEPIKIFNFDETGLEAKGLLSLGTQDCKGNDLQVDNEQLRISTGNKEPSAPSFNL
ncbi:uncharacterized protein LOC111088485 [Limulus polyphemus]|uniref:Uncharacterized protein LOC111088485 n=1 Tax=Limulus polyphemus TaxID=6850 RepID=A0ABM1TF29_LIMPO|nr:uncharacterized protein LOC111088485 [Limulus polyphemus]